MWSLKEIYNILQVAKNGSEVVHINWSATQNRQVFIYTILFIGSIYCDVGLRNMGFSGEGVISGSVLVVKTHRTRNTWMDKGNPRTTYTNQVYYYTICKVPMLHGEVPRVKNLARLLKVT